MPTTPVQSNTGVSTGTIANQRIVVFRDDEIAQLDPIRKPLLSLMMHIGTDEVPGPVFQFLEEDRGAIGTQVNGAATLTGTPAGSTALVTVDEASIFKVGHTGYNVTGTTAAGGCGQIRFRVTAVDEAANQIQISLTNTADGLTITDNEELIVIGSAYPESSGRPVPMHVQPTNNYNYIQTFYDAFAASDIMQATNLYGEPEFPRLGRRTADRQMSDIEHTLWFGARHVQNADATTLYSTAAQPIWKTGGVVSFITSNVIEGTTDLSDFTYAHYVEEITDGCLYDPGNTFFGFSGADFINQVNSGAFMAGAGATNAPIHQERSMLEEVFGLRVSRIRTGHGDVLLIPHYEVMRRREATTTNPNFRAIMHAVLNLDLIKLRVLSGHSLLEIKENIEDPGTLGRIDGYVSHVGLEFKLQARHTLLRFLTA